MTEPRPVYTAHDIPDLINSLPTQFGFRPRDSLIAVATHGPRRRFGFRLRADLTPVPDVTALAAMTAGHLANNGADGAIIVALTDQQDLAREVIGAIEAELGDIEPIVVARADDHHYWVDLPGFPSEGIAYDASAHHVSIVQAIAAGQEILPDREALAARYAPVREPHRGWLRHAAHAEAARIADLAASVDPADLAVTGLDELQPIVVAGVRGEPLDDRAVTVFSIWVGFIPVRDAIWEMITHDTAVDMHRMLVQVAARVVPPFEPVVLSLTAFAAWLGGNGTEALIAVERALGADPDHALAALLHDLIGHGVPPSAWRGRQDLRPAG